MRDCKIVAGTRKSREVGVPEPEVEMDGKEESECWLVVVFDIDTYCYPCMLAVWRSWMREPEVSWL